MAKLTAKRRAKLPAKDFGEPSKRAYPDDTLARSRSALARGKHYLSGAQYRKLAERIHRKHPTMQIAVLKAKR